MSASKPPFDNLRYTSEELEKIPPTVRASAVRSQRAIEKKEKRRYQIELEKRVQILEEQVAQHEKDLTQQPHHPPW